MGFKGVSFKETVNVQQWGSKIHTQTMVLLSKSIYYHCKSVKS